MVDDGHHTEILFGQNNNYFVKYIPLQQQHHGLAFVRLSITSTLLVVHPSAYK